MDAEKMLDQLVANDAEIARMMPPGMTVVQILALVATINARRAALADECRIAFGGSATSARSPRMKPEAMAALKAKIKAAVTASAHKGMAKGEIATEVGYDGANLGTSILPQMVKAKDLEPRGERGERLYFSKGNAPKGK